MIRMPLDNEGVRKSPIMLSLSEQPQLAKPRPLLQGPPTKPIRKRRFSLGASLKGPAKRRRRANSVGQSEPVLPSNFLLGGNIFDPLNLNSLLDEEINRSTNQETPQSSPLPSRGHDPVEILVPCDITDPLNLRGGGEEGAVLLSSQKKKRHRTRNHNSERGTKVPVLTTEGAASSPLPCELNTAITCRDDVAPPPILPRRHTHPPLGSAHKAAHRRRRRTTSTKSSDTFSAVAAQPVRFQTPVTGEAKAHGCPRLRNATPPQKNKRCYLHGNHLRYYGYQGCYGSRWEGRVGAEPDPRLRLLQDAWFKDRTVLDIGCGAGHMTLAVARRFGPAHILGLDIDGKLVHAANQNVRHFMSHDLVVEERRRSLNEAQPPLLLGARPHLKPLPLSLRISLGPLSAPPLLPANSTHSFPHNITFIQGDYLSHEEAWPGRGLYDVILCLGVTKYVQLQSGDLGLVMLFKRAYQSLSPGGLFILEPQPWSSYRHKRRVSEAVFHHHSALKLRPQQFTSYLTDNVGFSSYTLLTHTGNNRPIYLFNKGPAHRK